MLEELVVWCKTWRMKVNIEKTQIVHFRSKQTSKTETIFYLGPQALGIVNQYRYLGLILTKHMCYKAIGDALAMGAERALGKLVVKYYQNQGLGYKTYKKLYDACVRPVMDYCSGIWGYEAHEKLDRIHVRALRTFLDVNRHTAIAGIEGEMCWIPPIIRRKI